MVGARGYGGGGARRGGGGLPRGEGVSAGDDGAGRDGGEGAHRAPRGRPCRLGSRAGCTRLVVGRRRDAKSGRRLLSRGRTRRRRALPRAHGGGRRLGQGDVFSREGGRDEPTGCHDGSRGRGDGRACDGGRIRGARLGFSGRTVRGTPSRRVGGARCSGGALHGESRIG